MTEARKGKKVGILGAGPSGLVAAKEALQNGLIPTLFEKESGLGGVWNLVSGSVWDTMHTNLSKFAVTFGDTQWPQEDDQLFPSAQSMFAYFKSYADKWNISNLIKFQSKVISVQSVTSGSGGSQGSQGWRVSWVEGDGSSGLKSEIFDGVIVATGILAKPHFPDDIPGMETFPGKLIHSKEYKTGRVFRDERVLVIGGSASGGEIATDVSNYTNHPVVHSFREPVWILKRYLAPSSPDSKLLISDWLWAGSRAEAQNNAKLTLAARAEDVILNQNKALSLFCEEQQEFEALKVSEEEMTKPIPITLSDEYVNKVRDGSINPKRQKILEISGSKVKLESGEVVEVDAIICGTGYHVDNSIFDDDVLSIIQYDESDRFQPCILFNTTVHPDLENLFFVGMYKVPFFGVMEQQARWAARVLADKVTLPPRDVMLDGLREEEEIRNRRPRPQFPHPDNVNFGDRIAKCAGSFPDVDKLELEGSWLADGLGQPSGMNLEERKAEIIKRFMNGLVTTAHYNLVTAPQVTLEQMEFVDQVTNNL